MGKCGACGKFISSSGAAACGICPGLYHKACVGIPDSSNPAKDWTCPECKRKIRKSDNTTTPIRGISAAALSTRDLLVQQPAVTIDTNSDIREMRKELAEYMAELRLHRSEMAELRNALAMYKERMDSIERRLEAVERREQMPVNVAELETTVAQLKSELNDRDQDTLLADVDIGNIPEEQGENVIHTVTVLASKLGVPLTPTDIVFAERVGTVERSPPSEVAVGKVSRARRIVVRLARRQLRDELLTAARVRRTLSSSDLGAGGPPRRVYVNERLTRFNRQLFHTVREECRRLHWRYSWTKRGRIYARQHDGSQVYPIRTATDVVRVFQSANV